MRSRGEPILPLDLELNRTLRRMNIQYDLSYIDYEINPQLPPPVDAHKRVIVDNPGECNPKRQPPAPHPQEYYRGNVNITNSDGTLFLTPLPHGHTFVVTSSLMQMLTARGLFSGLPFEDTHVPIAKLKLVCKHRVGRTDLDMHVI